MGTFEEDYPGQRAADEQLETAKEQLRATEAVREAIEDQERAREDAEEAKKADEYNRQKQETSKLLKEAVACAIKAESLKSGITHSFAQKLCDELQEFALDKQVIASSLKSNYQTNKLWCEELLRELAFVDKAFVCDSDKAKEAIKALQSGILAQEKRNAEQDAEWNREAIKRKKEEERWLIIIAVIFGGIILVILRFTVFGGY